MYRSPEVAGMTPHQQDVVTQFAAAMATAAEVAPPVALHEDVGPDATASERFHPSEAA